VRVRANSTDQSASPLQRLLQHCAPGCRYRQGHATAISRSIKFVARVTDGREWRSHWCHWRDHLGRQGSIAASPSCRGARARVHCSQPRREQIGRVHTAQTLLRSLLARAGLQLGRPHGPPSCTWPAGRTPPRAAPSWQAPAQTCTHMPRFKSIAPCALLKAQVAHALAGHRQETRTLAATYREHATRTNRAHCPTYTLRYMPLKALSCVRVTLSRRHQTVKADAARCTAQRA
jgi:hypothetical protein